MCGKNVLSSRKPEAKEGSPPRVREELTFSPINGNNLGITPACAGRTRATVRAIPGGRDHPRVCGKNLLFYYRKRERLGSPPRVREELTDVHRGKDTVGITPACAGRTYLTPVTAPYLQDHPRVCGKNLIHPWSRTLVRGSPPRVREEPATGKATRAERGITPACAGRTIFVVIC